MYSWMPCSECCMYWLLLCLHRNGCLQWGTGNIWTKLSRDSKTDLRNKRYDHWREKLIYIQCLFWNPLKTWQLSFEDKSVKWWHIHIASAPLIFLSSIIYDFCWSFSDCTNCVWVASSKSCSLYCFDAVRWMTGRASWPIKIFFSYPKSLFLGHWFCNTNATFTLNLKMFS